MLIELQLETTTNNKTKHNNKNTPQGGGLPYKKGWGAHWKPLRDTKIMFGGCGLKFFHLSEVPILQ